MTETLSNGVIWANSIVYTSRPSHRYFKLPTLHEEYSMPGVINYSQLYKEFVTENVSPSKRSFENLIHPQDIVTGDILQTDEYRGVGTYFAIWLCAGIYQNRASLNTHRAIDTHPKQDTQDRYSEKVVHPGDSGASRGSSFNWTQLQPGDELFQDRNTPQISKYFQGISNIMYPLLKDRNELSAAYAKRPWMELYLFQHPDEMGYTAPTAFSMAPKGYFCTDYCDRHIDLALLPPPLDLNTTFGFVLTQIRNRFLSSLPIVSDSEDAEDNIGEEDEDDKQQRLLRGKKGQYEIGFIDFEGNNSVYWANIERASENVLLTRKMFYNHAQIIREKLIALHGSQDTLNAEDLKNLFTRLLWSV